jgi:hypothetical protein
VASCGPNFIVAKHTRISRKIEYLAITYPLAYFNSAPPNTIFYAYCLFLVEFRAICGGSQEENLGLFDVQQ